MAVQFAYPWNVPRSAISSPYLTYEQRHRRDRMFAALLHAKKVLSLQPDCVRLDVYRTAAVLEQNQGSQRANAFLISFCKKALPRLELVAKNTNALVSTARYQPLFLEVILILSKCNICRHAWLIWSPDITVSRTCRALMLTCWPLILLISFVVNLPTLMTTDSASLKRCTPGIFVLALFPSNSTLSHHIGSGLKKYVGADEIAPAIAKMFNDGWWRGRLRRVAATWREHLQIAVGNVSKKKTLTRVKTA